MLSWDGDSTPGNECAPAARRSARRSSRRSSAAAGAPPRVTLIGDSVATGIPGDTVALATLRSGIDLQLELAPCRSVAGTSCPYGGVSPPTVVDIAHSSGSQLGPTVIVEAGYDDFATGIRRRGRPGAAGAAERRGHACDLAHAARVPAADPVRRDERHAPVDRRDRSRADARRLERASRRARTTGSRATAFTSTAGRSRHGRAAALHARTPGDRRAAARRDDSGIAQRPAAQAVRGDAGGDRRLRRPTGGRAARSCPAASICSPPDA